MRQVPVLAALGVLMLALGGGVQAQEIQKYWVYCIDGKTSVEMWDLEQMKVRRGSNVCQLYEDTSVSGATDWMNDNFPSGTCRCRR